MKKHMTKVVVTNGYRWSYFQWFILGLYELHNTNEIQLRFRLPLGSWLLTIVNNILLIKIADKIRTLVEKDSYNLKGYVVFPNGVKKFFCIDCADAPYLYDEDDLKRVNCYFKMQCPKDLEKEYFELTDEIKIPWLSHRHVQKGLKLTERGTRKECHSFGECKHKIKPLMIGPRQLSRGNSYSQLVAGYNNYRKDISIIKTKKLMCYFGNALGPKPEKCGMDIDYDWESDIMAYYGEKIEHPNEKRAKVCEYISTLGGDYDARIINRGNADMKNVQGNSLEIPLENFCQHISKFQYNFNVSGYRMSIPNRFLESFMVGTGIVTDKLAVKWYKPFESCEVVETVRMGYLLDENVEWESFKNDINNLPKSEPRKILQAFEEKWAPSIVARYIIQTIKNS